MASQGHSTKHIKRRQQPSPSTIVKTEEEGTLPDSFYEPSITLISKPKTLQKKSHANICDDYKCKKFSIKHWQINSTKYKKESYTMLKCYLFQWVNDSSVLTNQSMWHTILTNWRIKSHDALNRCRKWYQEMERYFMFFNWKS